ncbi:MAG: HAD family hydrolase [Gemmataceae bacterium]
MGKVRGLLLDIDGTLVDSNDAHARAWIEALAKNNLHVPFDKVRLLIGMGGDKLLPKATSVDADSDLGKQITKDRQTIFLEKYLPTLQPCPGAFELLEELHQRGIKMVVASSATQKELKSLLKICGADKVITAKTSSDDADNSKPDPDIVHAALKEIELPADEVMMLGDTPYDIEAASKAGVGTIALRCGGWPDDCLRGAKAIYDNPADLLRQIERSPLA